MGPTHRHRTPRFPTAALVATLLAMPTLPALAIDWDGDFPVDGNYDGKIDNPDNWDPNTLPGTTTTVVFDEAGTYSVLFGTNFETGGGAVLNGDVTFETLGGTPVYSVNGNFVATGNGTLTLEGVDIRSGTSTPLGLFTEGGGSITLRDGNVSVVELLRVAPDASAGTMTIDNTTVQVDDRILIYGNAAAGGGLLTLQNGADVQVINGTQVQLGRSMNVASTLRVTGGSSLYAEAGLFMADFDIFNGSAVLELMGAGSSFELAGGYDALIGADAMSSARFTAFTGTNADFGGKLIVQATGTFENRGGTVTVDGTTQIDGTFEQTTGGSTVFHDTVGFDGGASLVHTGGTIRFRDDTTIAFQDLTFGGSSGTSWDVDADVAFSRRLRLAGDQNTNASITVADIDGNDAVLRNTAVSGQADLAVGFSGNGQVFINNHGLVDIFDDVIIGQNAGSNGQVFVNGDGTFDLTDRATLRVNRNGGGSNLFVGFNGEGLLNVAGGGFVEVGNDLVVQTIDTPGASSTVTVGVDPSLALASIDTVDIGGDLLIGNVGGNGGTSSGLYWQRDRAQTTVGGTTHVRATGELRADHFSTFTTTGLITDAGSTLDIDGGIITVDGGTATLNHGDLVLNGDTSVAQGRGVLQLVNGADAVLDGELFVANAPGEFGLLDVRGPGSAFRQTGGLKNAFIGSGGFGEISITDGGFVEINAELLVAQGSGSTGMVQVGGVSSGVRSTLVVDNLNDASYIRLGQDAALALMDITDGGLVQVGNALFVGDLLTTGGTKTLTIGGTEGGFSAELRAKFLTVTGATASADINDGALVVLSSNTPFSQLQAFNGGEINLTGGEVFAPQVARDAGSTINWTGGTLHTEEVQNDLTNAGGTLAPGLGQAVTLGTTTLLNDYTQTSAGTIEIELAGTTQGTEYDFVDVDGTLSLAGTLEVLLIGAAPTVGDSYDILDWGTLAGTFDTLDLPGVGNGNTWDVDSLYTDGTIAVIRSGDLNSDGVVGAADLDIILAYWGQNVTPLDETMGDASGNGFVDGDDLQIVLDQFGNTTYPGASAVPEPGTAALLSLAVLAGLRRRRR